MPIINNRPATVVAFSGNDIQICHDRDTENRLCKSLVLGQSNETIPGSGIRVLPFGSISDFDTTVRLEFTDIHQLDALIAELVLLKVALDSERGPGQEKLWSSNEEEHE